MASNTRFNMSIDWIDVEEGTVLRQLDAIEQQLTELGAEDLPGYIRMYVRGTVPVDDETADDPPERTALSHVNESNSAAVEPYHDRQPSPSDHKTARKKPGPIPSKSSLQIKAVSSLSTIDNASNASNGDDFGYGDNLNGIEDDHSTNLAWEPLSTDDGPISDPSVSKSHKNVSANSRTRTDLAGASASRSMDLSAYSKGHRSEEAFSFGQKSRTDRVGETRDDSGIFKIPKVPKSKSALKKTSRTAQNSDADHGEPDESGDISRQVSEDLLPNITAASLRTQGNLERPLQYSASTISSVQASDSFELPYYQKIRSNENSGKDGENGKINGRSTSRRRRKKGSPDRTTNQKKQKK